MNQFQRGFNAGYKAAGVERDIMREAYVAEKSKVEKLEQANQDLIAIIESSKKQSALFYVTESALECVRNNTHGSHVIRMVDPKKNKNAVAVYLFPYVVGAQ